MLQIVTNSYITTGDKFIETEQTLLGLATVQLDLHDRGKVHSPGMLFAFSTDEIQISVHALNNPRSPCVSTRFRLTRVQNGVDRLLYSGVDVHCTRLQRQLQRQKHVVLNGRRNIIVTPHTTLLFVGCVEIYLKLRKLSRQKDI